MKKKWIILSSVAGLALVGAAVYWTLFANGQEPADSTQMDQPPLPALAVDVGEVSKTVYATGVIEAKAREEVKADISGNVRQVFVQTGDRVEKGDPLFVIDNTESQLELQKQELNIVRLNRDLAELKNRRAEIVSESAGTVKEIMVKPGDTVTKETIVARLSNPDLMRVKGSFSASQVKYFNEGMSVQVFVIGSLSYLPGTVTKVDRKGKSTAESSIMHEVEVTVKNPGALHTSEYGLVEHQLPTGELFRSLTQSQFEPVDDIEIKAGTSGKVNEVLIEADDNVQSGQVVARLDLTEVELERMEKELALKEAQLTLQQKKQELEKNVVTAPISGEVTQLDIKAGDQVDSSKPAAVLLDTSSVYMKASVDEVDIPLIQPGQEVDVYVTAFGNTVFKGEVVEVPKEGVSQEKSVRFEVKVLVKDGGKMKHGMTGDCDIIVNRKENVLRLPLHAVEIIEEGKGMVTVKNPKDGQPMPKEVEIGIEGAEFVEIKSGLSPGDEVLLMGMSGPGPMG